MSETALMNDLAAEINKRLAVEREVKRLKEALTEIERCCPPWSAAFGIEQIGKIARDALYPEWSDERVGQ